jgi:putative ABC transport system ATP-binding protein
MAETTALPIQLVGVNHYYGGGTLRRQILFDVSVEIRAGEIVIVTGPSGSGKTTLLTLIGALRSAQEGSVRVLGAELRGASGRALQTVRRRIGYIFQAHNLLDALTASQNVEMALHLDPSVTRRQARRRARAMLEAVGLGDRADHHPGQLSGGQRQRVAIARALVAEPRIILADEPTASLDRTSGREIVDLMHDLARRQGVTVLLVTHDNRILDIADRIVHLEDGRLSSFTQAVAAHTRHMMDILAHANRKGELVRRVAELPASEFGALLSEVTKEAEQFLRVTELGEQEAFQSMLDEALSAFTFRFGELLDAERASLFLVDAARGELWLKVAREEGGKPVQVRMPIGRGIAGHVARTGAALRVDDAYAHPLFNPDVDRETGYRTRNILCVPIADRSGQVFAVAQLLNKRGDRCFEETDEERFRAFTASLGVVLESWARMSRDRRGSP